MELLSPNMEIDYNSLLKRAIDSAQSIRHDLNSKLVNYEPLQLVVCTLLAATLLRKSVGLLGAVLSGLQDHGIKGSAISFLFRLLRALPGVAGYIEREQEKVAKKLQGSMTAKRQFWRTELPKSGLRDGIVEEITSLHAMDKAWHGRCSGTVYMGGQDYDKHLERVTFAYSMFSHTNPLHPDVFPSIAQFEAEVVAMTASMLGAQSKASGGEVCGNMTSGGSESILMAVKSTRDYMRATKNITAPEMIIAESAHAAYDKAAQYFGIKLRRAPVGPDFRADVKALRRLINRNTIMMVGSAPGFPHGLIDPIEELGRLALRKRICLHVDLCLGGFVLPFARKLGYPIPSFDFDVPGVTSMSVDTHKYGLAPKGSSVVLYRNHRLRRHQFVAVTEWSGGFYISPSAAGSRPGGLIAASWASLMALGEDGYLEITRAIMEASKRIIEGISRIDGLHVLGEPEMTVIAFGSDELDIYKVNDVMTAKGWSLSALQRPASVHICVTLQHVDMVESFLQDLADSVTVVRKSPDAFPDGMAPIYGAAAKMPDRGTIKDLLVAYMDATC